MATKKVSQLLIMIALLFLPLWAGELKVRNEATTAVEVTIRARANNSSSSSVIAIQTIQPGEEITVVLNEQKFKGTVFLIQGITITNIPVLPLISNECVLNAYEGVAAFFHKADGTALICSLVKTTSGKQPD